MAGRSCPCGCGQQVEGRRLLASTCWQSLPFTTQQAVERTWRAYDRVPEFASWRDYRAVRDEAVRLARAIREGRGE